MAKPTEPLPCPLSQRECIARAKQAYSIESEIAELEVAHGKERDAFKERKKELIAARMLLSRQAATGVEDRPVEIEERPDHKNKVVNTFRLDTNKLVRSRDMEEHESQLEISGMAMRN